MSSTPTNHAPTVAVGGTATPHELSGITPSGALTLGNHLGALRRFRQHQDGGFHFVANLHALTTDHDPARLRHLTLSTAALYLASGLDPDRATVFVQSDVPAHVELSYLMESTAHIGELGRMIQFKEKGGRPGTRASLFTYPCLMAADILLYDAEQVPVGSDQSQHVELARDLAERFNATYGQTFTAPKLASAAIAARVRDLALVPDKQPGAREQLFEFFGEDAVIDKDFAADDPALGIDETPVRGQGGGGHGGSVPLSGLDPDGKLGRCCDHRNALPEFGVKDGAA